MRDDPPFQAELGKLAAKEQRMRQVPGTVAKRTPPTTRAAQRQLEALGERLRAARKRRDLSQGALAELVGVHVQTWKTELFWLG